MDVGRFVSDTQIDLPHPRTKAGDRFVELRTKLLADLGVTDVA